MQVSSLPVPKRQSSLLVEAHSATMPRLASLLLACLVPSAVAFLDASRATSTARAPPPLLLQRKGKGAARGTGAHGRIAVGFDLSAVREPRNPGYVSDDFGLKAGAVGSAANAVTLFSLSVLKETGCGLPAGFLGLEGLVEGVSYLVVVWVFLWSALTKVQTGGGLPAGKFGLLGLAEGLSFLTVFGGIVVALLNFLTYGYVSSPTDYCGPVPL